MKIGIPLSKSAYTPESYAYKDYLEKLGHLVELDYQLDPNNDINIYFMGIKPFWKKEMSNCINVHEYQSLSTPPFAGFKNLIKHNINKKPHGRIFLNNFVKLEMSFNDNVPTLIRDMGVDKSLFQSSVKNPDFDITYCGSIAGRKGLIEEIIRLSTLGFKIQVIGRIDIETTQVFEKYSNIKVWGRVCRSEIPELYKNSKYGLNFIPDIYPFNKQTSTKVLEYIASGLMVLSNKYDWISEFSIKNSFDVIWLDNVNNIEDIECIDKENLIFKGNSMIKELEWSKVLDRSGFHNFLLNLLND